MPRHDDAVARTLAQAQGRAAQAKRVGCDVGGVGAKASGGAKGVSGRAVGVGAGANKTASAARSGSPALSPGGAAGTGGVSNQALAQVQQAAAVQQGAQRQQAMLLQQKQREALATQQATMRAAQSQQSPGQFLRDLDATLGTSRVAE